MNINMIHPVEWNNMMMTITGITFRQLDSIRSLHVIYYTDMAAVDRSNFHMLFDLVGINHGIFLLRCHWRYQ